MRLKYDYTCTDDGATTQWNYAPYPPDTDGFLYYYMPPGKPRIAGELRLRVTSSDDPASFGKGSDLLRLNGLPWSRPLYYLFKYYFPLYEKLREDQFIPDDLHRVLSTLPFGKPSYRRIHQRLYTLNDPLVLDLSQKSQYLFIVTERGMEVIMVSIFFDYRAICSVAPYTGAHLQKSPSLALTLCIDYFPWNL